MRNFELTHYPSSPSQTARSLRVLLAEDNKLNQKLAMAVLSAAGYVVALAENGLEAVSAIEHEDYDVVLMDARMPEMDGVEATALIRAMESPKSDIPIIVLTANAMAGARTQYLAAGADDYLTKPIDTKALLAKLVEIGQGASAPPTGGGDELT